MPLDLGVSEMLTAEWERFITGLEELSYGGQRRARAAAGRADPATAGTRTVTIPGWDDTIHLLPAPTITPEMRAAHYAARRAGRPSPLSPVLVAEIERRSRRARAMSSSAAPEYAKAWGQVMTALDNVQDLLTSVATTGRFVLVGGARLLDSATTRFISDVTPELLRRASLIHSRELKLLEEQFKFLSDARKTALFNRILAELRLGALGKLGTRTLGRLVPVIGPVLLAADLLKLLTLLGSWAFPGFALLCSGLTTAGAASIGTMVFGRGLKLRATGANHNNPFGWKARLRRSRMLRSWRPSISNLIEVGQTTDQLWGVGVSFGGLVGLLFDSAFAAEGAARGVPWRVQTTPSGERTVNAARRIIERIQTPALWDYRAASHVLSTGPVLDRVQEVFTFQEHVEFLAAQCAAWSLIGPLLDDERVPALIEEALDVEWAPPIGQHDDTLAIVREELGLDGPEGLWPLPGTPRTVRGEHYMLATANECAAALRELLLPRPDSIEANFAGALVMRMLARSTYYLTGSADPIEWELAPEWQLIESLAEGNRLVNTTEPIEKIWAFYEAATAKLDQEGRRKLAPQELDQLAAAAGLSLIRIGPIGAVRL